MKASRGAWTSPEGVKHEGRPLGDQEIVRKLREAEGKLAGGAKVSEVAREFSESARPRFTAGESSTAERAPRKPSASRSWSPRTPA
jgi:hypothetical protein